MNPNDMNDQDYAKKEAESYRFGLSLLLIIVFTVGRTVQLFSRIPGSSGAAMTLAGMGGILMQVFYYKANVEASQIEDAIPIEYMLILQLAFFGISIIALVIRRFREEVDPFIVGTGVLTRFFPNSQPFHVDVLSDMLIATAIAVFFFAMDSPIQGGWFRAMLFWMLIGHLWIAGLERVQSSRLKNAQRRADYWSHRLPR